MLGDEPRLASVPPETDLSWACQVWAPVLEPGVAGGAGGGRGGRGAGAGGGVEGDAGGGAEVGRCPSGGGLRRRLPGRAPGARGGGGPGPPTAGVAVRDREGAPARDGDARDG